MVLAPALGYIGQDSAAGGTAAESPPAMEVIPGCSKHLMGARGMEHGHSSRINEGFISKAADAGNEHNRCTHSAVRVQRFLSLAGFI
ncbi:hypothetical protein H70357_08120 [Paenibacillus sp. FSL H7-0357]|nr:hypothetical protein H70357_08120 [Paenibacillus sp. FSL H7-0357]